MESLLTAQSGRLDRHVRKSYLRLGQETSRYRISFSLEEALRLCNLPGEEEGRIYCFRRVSLGGMDAESNRRVWIQAMGRVMDEMASLALHGSHPFAGASNAVYFNSREEALEWLLRKALAEVEADAANAPEWFSNSLLGLPSGACHEKQIHSIAEVLQRSPNPGAGAALFFAALGERSPIHLLSAISEEEFRAWVRNLDSGTAMSDGQHIPIAARLSVPLLRAGAECGWAAPGTVWLAVQAVLCIAPASLRSGSLVSRARSLLRQLQAERRNEENTIVPAQTRLAVLRFDEELDSAAANWILPRLSLRDGSDGSVDNLTRNGIASTDDTVDEGAAAHVKSAGSDRAMHDAQVHTPTAKEVPGAPPLLGESTSSGGLFFLLHVLRHLDIAVLLERYPLLAEADFAGHILRNLADKAGALADDPIRTCLPPPNATLSLPEELLSNVEFLQACAPRGFHQLAASITGGDALMRIWMLAVRRWCWRTAHLTLRDIVCRQARVWLTRNDLDVTFPLAQVNIRIRRIGLDIDPGWVPWLGLFGKVVRFHYREGERA
jgi:hypothetical protein